MQTVTVTRAEAESSLKPLSTLPAAQTYVIADVVSKMAEVAASPNTAGVFKGGDNEPTYIPPGLEVLQYPTQLNSFDSFTVSGQAWGSAIDGKVVQVSIAGITRTARIIDGLWAVTFEDGAIPRHRHGNREITAILRDSLGNAARSNLKVTLEEFSEGYVQVDELYSIIDDGKTLIATGELALGTHDQKRELIVLLVRDDAESTIAATGTVTSGWQFGEWRARIPLHGLATGTYKVRAQLMDCANAALTHIAMGVEPVIVC